MEKKAEDYIERERERERSYSDSSARYEKENGACKRKGKKNNIGIVTRVMASIFPKEYRCLSDISLRVRHWKRSPRSFLYLVIKFQVFLLDEKRFVSERSENPRTISYCIPLRRISNLFFWICFYAKASASADRVFARCIRGKHWRKRHGVVCVITTMSWIISLGRSYVVWNKDDIIIIV